ncbi:hypothetical protein FF38_05032 [Lucilia cuprina]|uniref:Uncharacterized protein n=1 Tax=Lucilia cuprina TaxID=7375 RepID=A0A0L0CK95_LUCCU|nr:hypothetical protein FF38_05032 [Lucilia cuprina]
MVISKKYKTSSVYVTSNYHKRSLQQHYSSGLRRRRRSRWNSNIHHQDLEGGVEVDESQISTVNLPKGESPSTAYLPPQLMPGETKRPVFIVPYDLQIQNNPLRLSENN